MSKHPIAHRRIQAGPAEVFYREAGDPSAPTLLLLHGFPTSSHQYVGLMRELAGHWHLVAPDLPGFGQTETEEGFEFTFEALASVLGDFVDALGLSSYALYVFDFGAPAGLRLAARRPQQITALITQNGNAYVEGFGPAMPDFANQGSRAEVQSGLEEMLSPESIRWQYYEGVRNPEAIDPGSYQLDRFYLEQPGRAAAQADLLWDYRNNPPAYPEIHRWLRESQPPVLAVWGRNDPFFIPAGAEAFTRDAPSAQVHLLDTGHFALEEELATISELVDRFLRENVDQ
ncbi:alpha/beta fold hydrolase [Amycolatopsis sp. NPDC059657]|uniref:alpha/beta fold hydrolase n=1 Tax=Amycolatopsis sp. NPDC059657 TaxID=3346899 RepID=UPI003671EBDC